MKGHTPLENSTIDECGRSSSTHTSIILSAEAEKKEKPEFLSCKSIKLSYSMDYFSAVLSKATPTHYTLKQKTYFFPNRNRSFGAVCVDC